MNISSTLFAKTIKQKFIDNNIDYYDGGLGENPLPQPPCLIKEVEYNASLKEYTNAKGIPELRKLFNNKILVGNGLKPLLFILQLAFHKLYPDGVIYHIVPFWVSYEEQTKILGIKSKRIIPKDKINWKITPEDLRKYLPKDKKHLIIFNNPSNPTGCIYNKEEVYSLCQVFEEFGSYILADDIYENIVHKEKDLGQVKDFYPKTISGSSLSKMVACGGYRLGYLEFHCNDLNNLYDMCNIIASSVYSCPSLIFQHVAVKVLEYPKEIVEYLVFQRELFTNVKNVIIEDLKDTKLILSESNAAWYVLINFDNYRDKLKDLGIVDSHQLSKYLIDEMKIIMVAGQNFGIENQLILRYSYIDIIDIDLEDKYYNLEKIRILLLLLKDWLIKM